MRTSSESNGELKSIELAAQRGVKRESIVIDPGIGFGKSQIGTAQKSFIGRILADGSGNPAPVKQRLQRSLATMTAAILKGAHIVRVRDLRAAVDTFE